MASLKLAFDILAKDSASKTFKQVGDNAEKSAKRVEQSGGRASRGLGGIAKIAGPVGAALAGIGAVNVLSGFIKDAAESAKIGRLTEAVLKSTGGAARISADQVGALAESLSNKTAVDDEAIQAGANVLLTFTKVRNEAGKGNDVFNQGTKAALNLSAALGTDLQAANILVGKALNDPIKGVGALSKAGVSFTKQQKEQIKTLVESGDTLGAQKIILQEFQTQFGGAAEAAADPLSRLQVVAGNLGEKVGAILLPAAESFATYLSDTVAPAVATFIQQFQDGTGRGGEFRDQINDLREKFIEAKPQIEAFIVAVRDFASGFQDNVVPALKVTIDIFKVVLRVIREVAQNFLTTVGTLLGGFELLFRVLGKLPGEFGAPFRKAGEAVAGAKAKVDNLNRALDGVAKTRTVNLNVAEVGRIAASANQLARERRASGDGPGRGGRTLSRVSKLIAGTGASISSTLRTPERNRAVGGSPTSYHLDRNNPAVDVVGPVGVLNNLERQLRSQGGIRELLWQVPGHFDHLHVADKGGVFQGPGLVYMGAGQETFASGLQPAKKISDLPAARASVVVNVYGSVTTERDLVRTISQAIGADADLRVRA